MRVDSRFEVAAPADRIWASAVDGERLAKEVEGLRIHEHPDERTFRIALRLPLELRPMTWTADVEIVERDDARRRAVLRAAAAESRGQGTAHADVEISVDGDDRSGGLAFGADVKLLGRIAAVDEGPLQRAVERMVTGFAEGLAAAVGVAAGDATPRLDVETAVEVPEAQEAQEAQAPPPAPEPEPEPERAPEPATPPPPPAQAPPRPEPPDTAPATAHRRGIVGAAVALAAVVLWRRARR